MKFAFAIATLVLVTAYSFGQGCSGGSFSQNIREHRVVRTTVFARGGCSGHVASTGCAGIPAYTLVPQTVMVTRTVLQPVQVQVPVTTYARVPVALVVQAAPPVAAPPVALPAASGPVTYVYESEEPRLAHVRPIRGLIDRIKSWLHLSAQVAVAPVHRLVEVRRTRGCP